LTQQALGAHTNAITGISIGYGAEQITATSAGSAGPWVELRRYFDPGWRLDTLKVQSLGDGLFGLYHLDAAHAAAPRLTFSFSTTPYERIGEVISLIVVATALTLSLRELRRVRLVAIDLETAPPDVFLPSRLARWIAAAGMAMLAVTAIAVTAEWFGVPSIAPETGFAADPYGLDVAYGGVAILILLFALLAVLVSHVLGARRHAAGEKTAPMPARMGAAATLAVSVVVLTSCAGSPDDIRNLLSEAQQAGAVAPSIEGASLDDARLQRAARQPDLCIADYTQALTVYPDLVTAFAGRGDCYLNGGKDALGAYHDYSQAITLSPNQSDLYLRRAVADRVEGNYAASIADYKQAAAVPAANANQQLTAIDGLVSIREYDKAHSVYVQALQRNPTSSALHVAGGDLAIATGNDQLADQEFASASQLVTNKGELAQVLTHECHAEVLRHQYDKASTDCANAAKLSDNASGAYDDLAATQLALGNLTAALKDVDASIGSFIANVGPYAQPAGVDGFGLTKLYEARGWIDIQLHRTGDAIVDFQRSIQALPSDAPDTRARIKADITTAKAD
jgi:tetratricopeptide (TPR) repeat protein